MDSLDDDYRIALEVCPTPILVVAKDGTVRRSNDRLDLLFGYEPNELVGQAIEVLVPPETRGHHPDLRDAFFEIPTHRSMGTGRDLFGIRKDGERIPVEIGLDPILLGPEELIMVSVIDIRERKISEATLLRALNAAATAMIQVDTKGVIELVNRRAEELFGYRDGELIGRKIDVLVPERSRRKHTVYRTSYQNDHTTRDMGRGRELMGLRKNGTEVPVEVRLTPVAHAKGHSTMATVTDIADRSRQAKEAKEESEELHRMNEELLQLTYTATSELKDPLLTISELLTTCDAALTGTGHDKVEDDLRKARDLAVSLADSIESRLRDLK